jgi:hypothetical protein
MQCSPAQATGFGTFFAPFAAYMAVSSWLWAPARAGAVVSGPNVRPRMSTQVKAPTAAELQAALGSADALWSGIVHAVEDLVSPLDTEWKPSKTEFGRICLLQHKKRTLLYLAPKKESVSVAIVLGERAYGLAMASTLPAAIKKMFSEARPYAEGRGIRFLVSSPNDISTIKKLVEIKTMPK